MVNFDWLFVFIGLVILLIGILSLRISIKDGKIEKFGIVVSAICILLSVYVFVCAWYAKCPICKNGDGKFGFTKKEDVANIKEIGVCTAHARYCEACDTVYAKKADAEEVKKELAGDFKVEKEDRKGAGSDHKKADTDGIKKLGFCGHHEYEVCEQCKTIFTTDAEYSKLKDAASSSYTVKKDPDGSNMASCKANKYCTKSECKAKKEKADEKKAKEAAKKAAEGNDDSSEEEAAEEE